MAARPGLVGLAAYPSEGSFRTCRIPRTRIFPTARRTGRSTQADPRAGRHGIVVSQNREAAEAGAAILEAGGNAADAAVAACFALAAVEPWNSGLGGIGFAVVLKAD